jgi:hypothetical protein
MAFDAHGILWDTDDENASLLPGKNLMTTRAVCSSAVPPLKESEMNFQSGFDHDPSFLIAYLELID